MMLRASGILGGDELEILIDRILSQHEERVTLEELRSFLESGTGDTWGSLGEPTVH